MDRRCKNQFASNSRLFSPSNLQNFIVFLKIFKFSTDFLQVFFKSSSFYLFSRFSSKPSYYDMSERIEDVVEVEESGGGMLPLKWEERLFEQIVRGH
ncbi:hypothetical protein Hanom_Chr10g00964021 [Helianthus anomalus]